MNWLLPHGDGKSALCLMISFSGIHCIQILPVLWWISIGCFCVTLCQVLDAPPPSVSPSLNTHLLQSGQGYTFLIEDFSSTDHFVHLSYSDTAVSHTLVNMYHSQIELTQNPLEKIWVPWMSSRLRRRRGCKSYV